MPRSPEFEPYRYHYQRTAVAFTRRGFAIFTLACVCIGFGPAVAIARNVFPRHDVTEIYTQQLPTHCDAGTLLHNFAVVERSNDLYIGHQPQRAFAELSHFEAMVPHACDWSAPPHPLATNDAFSTRASYDFNRDFAPLPILNQGRTVDCLPDTRALMTDAYLRVYNNDIANYDDTQAVWTQDSATAKVCQEDIATPAGEYSATTGDCTSDYFTSRGLDPHSYAGVSYALLHNAVVQIVLPDTVAFSSAYGAVHGRIPVLGYSRLQLPGSVGEPHVVLGVGFRPRGVLIQNSWGPRWGKDGRALLTWSFLSRYDVAIIPWAWQAHPLDGLDLA